MISKQYRLKEREVKKVLQRGKPFFSYGIVLNYTKNKFGYNRFAIVIGSKSVLNNVSRCFFRRKFYTQVQSTIEQQTNGSYYDFVFVVKKQTKLVKKSEESEKNFQKDIQFLRNKVIKK
ncbi:MAG: ribonuclease P protein component [Candidatus Gracilibacteria bacterium]|nr:ribonuclease P protein component [Candidatus Gracilibacteria bacterium]